MQPSTAGLDEIARRFGVSGAAEWQVLLNMLALDDGFVLVVLTVPDQADAVVCRRALAKWFEDQHRPLAVIEPPAPAALHDVARALLTVPDSAGRWSIWLGAAVRSDARDAPDWDLAWRHVLVALNRHRNPLQRRLGPLVLAGGTRLAPAMQEVASDLWSVRSLTLRLEPVLAPVAGERPPAARPAASGPRCAPDPDLALRMAARVRGRAGQEGLLASLLDRAGYGLAASGRRNDAETAWHEAASLFEAAGQSGEAARVWAEISDVSTTT